MKTQALEELREADRYIEQRRKHWVGAFVQKWQQHCTSSVKTGWESPTPWQLLERQGQPLPYRIYYRIDGTEIWIRGVPRPKGRRLAAQEIHDVVLGYSTTGAGYPLAGDVVVELHWR